MKPFFPAKLYKCSCCGLRERFDQHERSNLLYARTSTDEETPDYEYFCKPCYYGSNVVHMQEMQNAYSWGHEAVDNVPFPMFEPSWAS